MYLNNNGKTVDIMYIGLTVTLDVFKYKCDCGEKLIFDRLTVTLDVFK